MGCKIWVALVASFVSSTADADFDPDAYPRHETCALCHGLFGVSATGRFPNLGGQDPVYLTNQLQAFLAGERTNDGGQMAAIVTELQPGDIEQVVEWFSTQDNPAPYPADDTGRGQLLYREIGCGSCHDQAAELPGVPYLTAQKPMYLAKQMRDYIDGERGPNRLNVDHRALLPTETGDIEALSVYLGALSRE